MQTSQLLNHSRDFLLVDKHASYVTRLPWLQPIEST
ncbi:protein of unknown function [Candidatus Nitrospira inopinata]|uniref:Uncharacterized protein n=1 Tax=Candidatus Nitrospira inopinata TaxID=1715989 RepID=A0A0S4KV33_9BACT|nr:protein of unknown function [Candidatus Nitrospira inopinata]